MNLHCKLICFLFCCGVLSSSLFAQADENSIDMRLLKTLEQTISPDAETLSKLNAIVRNAANQIANLEQEKLKIQRESDDEELILTQIKVKNQEIKDIREERELQIQSVLNPEQLAIYNEKIKPEKPQVLHFGLHNRADCNVCKQ